jgi:hypothetical protein
MRSRLLLLAAPGALLLAGGTAGAQLPADSAARADTTCAAGADTTGARPCPAARRQRGGYVVPILGYTPETKLLGGLGLVRIGRRRGAPAGDRPTTLGARAIYTQEGQSSLALSGDWWTRGNAARYTGNGELSRFPFRFYGIGRAPSDTGERYEPRTVAAGATGQWRVRRALYLGGGYQLTDVAMEETSPTGLLRPGTITGSAGGRRASALALTSWDTRDNVYFARRGALVSLTGGLGARPLGSDFAFRRVRLDARTYVGRGRLGAVALQAVTEVAGGSVPFDVLPLVGGASVLRGNPEGRFRDRAVAAVQAEYRSGPIWARRFGFAAFAGAGDVAPRLGEIGGGVIPSAGAGLRYLLDPKERVHLRVDVAVGKNGVGPYIAFGEAF